MVYVALSPNQKKQLDSDEQVEPDENSKRFGLRSCPQKAVERAHKFMNWTLPGAVQEAEIPLDEFALYSVQISGLGYMVLTEENILQKGDGQDHGRQGYYRWWGCLSKKRSAFVDGVERNLFTISPVVER